MIRINLIKGRKAGGIRRTEATGGIPSLEGGDEFVQIPDEEIRKQAMGRILLFFLFPIGLWVWELQTLPGKLASLGALQEQLNQLNIKNESARKAQEDIKTIEGKQKIIKSQIETLESLRRDRQQEVRVLDTIQRIIPERVWLQKIDVSEGKMNMIGFAMTDLVLTSFLDVLARTSLLKDVSLIRSNEYLEDSTNLTVKRFEVSCGLEASQ